MLFMKIFRSVLECELSSHISWYEMLGSDPRNLHTPWGQPCLKDAQLSHVLSLIGGFGENTLNGRFLLNKK